MKEFFNKAELYLTSSDCRIYGEYIDMDSFIDWIFVHELTSNYVFFSKYLTIIDRRVVNLRRSAEDNGRQWPISGKVNGDEQLSYHEAVQRMKHSYEQRLCVLYQTISEL